LHNIDFRKYSSKLSNTEQQSVEEKAKEAFERYFELENILNFQETESYFNYPEIITDAAQAAAASNAMCIECNLGYDPIPNMIEMLEDKGFRVVEIDASASFNGLKADTGNQKVIVLRKTNPDFDIVRKRFTALHELVHHALQFPDNMDPKAQEKLCHSFASALLYPTNMALKEMHKICLHFYQNELVLIKKRREISLPAIIWHCN
jgi:Zn-dependent peptidase ImmA (M78 family)